MTWYIILLKLAIMLDSGGKVMHMVSNSAAIWRGISMTLDWDYGTAKTISPPDYTTGRLNC